MGAADTIAELRVRELRKGPREEFEDAFRALFVKDAENEEFEDECRQLRESVEYAEDQVERTLDENHELRSEISLLKAELADALAGRPAVPRAPSAQPKAG